MNKTLVKVLATMLLLCMIPATVITAIAHGPGVAGDTTENHSLDNANGQYVPESVFVDGEFDDAGWATDEWNYVDGNIDRWDSENPTDLNTTANYKYQLKYDRKYFYAAAVINLPEGVTNAVFNVYLSEQTATAASDITRGTTAGFIFTINGSAVDVKASMGGDEIAVQNGTVTGFTPNQCATLSDDAQWATGVKDGVVTIEFRNALDHTINTDYTIYGAKNKDLISYYVGLELPRDSANGAGKNKDTLYHPFASQAMTSMLVEPSAENWPYVNQKGKPETKSTEEFENIVIDGNLEELLWDTDNMIQVNENTGTYYNKPYDMNPIEYKFVTYSDGINLYGAAILNGEPKAPVYRENGEIDPNNKGTEFDIWFYNGIDERLSLEGNKDISVEYEVYSMPHYREDANGNQIVSYYTNEMLYYTNHQYKFNLYGEQYDNDREERDLRYDINPEASPDYYVFGTEDDYKQIEKIRGDHYEYGYSVINGKTYLEFRIDLESVHCAGNTNYTFYAAYQHKPEHRTSTTGAPTTSVTPKLYYPELYDANNIQITTNFWVTDYNTISSERLNYGPFLDTASSASQQPIRDAVAVIYDDYTKYYNDSKAYNSAWWTQVLLHALDNKGNYEIVEIIGEMEKPDSPYLTQKPAGSGYYYYILSSGTCYSAGADFKNGTLVEKADTTNFRAMEMKATINLWRVGDKLTIGGGIGSWSSINNKEKQERTVISYNGRLYEDDEEFDPFGVTGVGLTVTSTPVVQDMAQERGQYVKFAFENKDSGWTFLSELYVYGANPDSSSFGWKSLAVDKSYTYDNNVHVGNGTQNNTGSYIDNGKDLTDGDGAYTLNNNYNATLGYGTLAYTHKAFVGVQSGNFSITVDLEGVYAIERFGVALALNTTPNSGISVPEKVTVYVSDDKQKWEYAGEISNFGVAGTHASSALPVGYKFINIHSSGTYANSYYTPYTITRTMMTQPNGEGSKDYLLYRTNYYLPEMDKYGGTGMWMYNGTSYLKPTEHVAPDVVDIDGNLNDKGWFENGWTEVDGNKNATNEGASGVNYAYQLRTDGEYLYVGSAVNAPANSVDYTLYIKSGNQINTYNINGAAASALAVAVPPSTGKTAAATLTYPTPDGLTYDEGASTLTYPATLTANKYVDGALTTYAYSESGFYGYTEEIFESTSDGVWIWEGRPETRGFRFGKDYAQLVSSANAFINGYGAGADSGYQSIIEFKIPLSEFNGANGFEYYFRVSDGQGTTYYPHYHADIMPIDDTLSWPNTAAVVTAADLIPGGALWMRNAYAPVVNLGAKINANYKDKGPAIRFGALYTEEFIRRKSVSTTDNITDYWDVADLGIVILPTHLIPEGEELTIKTDKAQYASAHDIIDWAEGTNFADYETFVFYVTMTGIPADMPLSFSGYIDYYDENGSVTYYDPAMERSYTQVAQGTYNENEDGILPGQ